MAVSVSAVEASRPERLVAAADRLGHKIAQLEGIMADQRRASNELRQSWEGTAADAATARAERDLDRQEDLRARLRAIEQALQSGGARLSATRSGLVSVVGLLRGTGWRVSDDGTASPPPLPAFLVLLAPAFTAVIRRLLGVFADTDERTATAIAGAVQGPVPATPPGTLGDPRQLPPDDARPEDVKQWWDSLSRPERAGLVAAHPPELGNLNGIPAVIRDQVNRAVVGDDLNRVREAARRHGASVDQVLDHPGAYGLSRVEVTRYRNAEQARGGLERTAGKERPNGTTERPALLWAYRPLAFDGQGAAAIAIGDPDQAGNTAVVVPGTGNSVKDGWLGRDDAISLYDQMRRAAPDEATAVIAWMGYDAPDSPADSRIATPWLARIGGDLLAADVNGLAATHDDGIPSHLTVIGHSYGATTVADAFARSGMHAQDAVLIGCPGTDLADSAADFRLDGGRVYVGAASSDPVSWLGQGGPLPDLLNDRLGSPLGPSAGLGTDPAGDSFGSVRFDAEVPGRDGLNFSDHSSYYNVGSESLRAMTDIASGDAASLADSGLLAEGRRQLHVGLPDTVHVPFVGDIDLPDWDTRIPGTPAINDPEGDRAQGSITNDHQY